MAEADELVKQAVSAIKAGRKAEARSILERVVDQDQRHENAWLYLSGVVESPEEQEICLENVLAINPNNAKAKQGLETVRQKLKKSPPGPTSSAPVNPFGAPPPLPGVAFGQDDSMPDPQSVYGFGADSTPQPSSSPTYDWFSDAAEPFAASDDLKPDEDPGVIPTSVDWGGANTSKPAAHGSGRDVEMPSAQEWDAWVDGLNIAKDTPQTPTPADPFGSSSSPFVMDDPAPFGGTGYMVDDDESSFMDQYQPGGTAAPESLDDQAFGGSSAWTSPFGDEAGVEEEDSFSTFGGSDTAAPAFGAGPFDADDLYEEVSPASDPFGFDADAVEIGEEDLVFDFDDDSDIDDDIAQPVKKAAPKAAQPAAAAPKPGAEYFRLIPGEIEAKAGGVNQRGLMMLGGIVLLLVLNAVSFAMLLM